MDARIQLSQLNEHELLELRKAVVAGIAIIIAQQGSIALDGIGTIGYTLLPSVEVRFKDGLPLTMPSGCKGYWTPSIEVREQCIPRKHQSTARKIYNKLVGFSKKNKPIV